MNWGLLLSRLKIAPNVLQINISNILMNVFKICVVCMGFVVVVVVPEMIQVWNECH